MRMIANRKQYPITRGKSHLLLELTSFFSSSSYGAMWLTYEQVVQCANQGQLRGNEPLKWFKYITQNGTVHSLSILAKNEG